MNPLNLFSWNSWSMIPFICLVWGFFFPSLPTVRLWLKEIFTVSSVILALPLPFMLDAVVSVLEHQKCNFRLYPLACKLQMKTWKGSLSALRCLARSFSNHFLRLHLRGYKFAMLWCMAFYYFFRYLRCRHIIVKKTNKMQN